MGVNRSSKNTNLAKGLILTEWVQELGAGKAPLKSGKTGPRVAMREGQRRKPARSQKRPSVREAAEEHEDYTGQDLGVSMGVHGTIAIGEHRRQEADMLEDLNRGTGLPI